MALLKCRLLLVIELQTFFKNFINLQIIMKLRISKLQDNKIKPLKRRIRQLIEKIRLAEQQVDNMHKDIQYLESIKVQNNSITNEESLAQD
jgi:Na+/phosphate symporter